MQLGNEPSATAGQQPPYRPWVIMYDYITGHENIHVNNSGQNSQSRVRGAIVCRHAASTDT